MNPVPNLLFVYGSLRRHYQHPMASLLLQHARHLGPATVPGLLYLVSWYPGLVPAGNSGPGAPLVSGDLFQLKPESAQDLLERLDAYEGDEYERLKLDVTLRSSGETLPAWAYAMTVNPSSLQRIASGDFLENRGPE
jgi:gamma-glutamylcyclotransferase (GGCT)/AIG2-like uncharacterized protein YtfP